MTQNNQERLNDIGERMERGFLNVQQSLQGMDERLRALEQSSAAQGPLLGNQLRVLERRLDVADQESKLTRTLADANAKALQALQHVLELQSKTIQQHDDTIGKVAALLPGLQDLLSGFRTARAWALGLAGTVVAAGLVWLIGKLVVQAATGGTP